MGNGVTRVLQATCVEGGIPPPEFFEAFYPVSVPMPLSERLADALVVALVMCGYDPSRKFVGGFMRPLSDHLIDYFMW